MAGVAIRLCMERRNETSICHHLNLREYKWAPSEATGLIEVQSPRGESVELRRKWD